MDHAAGKIWADPDTPALCLLALFLDRFRPLNAKPADSPLHWAADTIRDEIREETGVETHPRNIDRLMAAITILTRPYEYYTSESGFHTLSQALACDWFEPDLAHESEPEEVLWALIETYAMDSEGGHEDAPKEGEHKRYSDAIVRYVNMIFRNDGFRRLPHILHSYGIPTDTNVWDEVGVDYGEEPTLDAAVDAGADAREDDLLADVADRIRDLAKRIRDLPLRKGNKMMVALELESAVARSR